MKVVGVDGCKAGWFAVALEGGDKWRAQVFPDANSLWRAHSTARLILIDIPIGLPSRETPVRRCELIARQLLGKPRSSSVFPVPARKTLGAKEYKQACRFNEQELGKRISRQTFGILPKIEEVDALLQTDAPARAVIREIHPELCFWALNGERSVPHRKKSKAGETERRRLLRKILPATDDIVAESLKRNLRKDVAMDDILDALVAGVTARASKDLISIPAEQETDETGLPMRMLYSSHFDSSS